MKLRFLFAIYALAAIFTLTALPTLSRAVTFPIVYEGTVHVTHVDKWAECAGDVNLKLILLADGTLEATTDLSILLEFTTCQIQSNKAKTYDGTHDKSGTFSVMLDFVLITGTFDDAAISGSGSAYDGFETRTYSFTLPILDRSPKITLEPATYPEFQMNILAGNGFTVKIRKEDGIWDSNGKSKLNFSTLVFATDGIDNSANFINTGADQKIFSVSSDEKEVLLKVTPDPNKFMNDQNVFNILLNGEHKIGLQICDTDGRCGKAEYTIYFGPFITVGSVSDLRCSQGKEQLSIENLIHGNMGYSSLISIYFAMINTDQPNEYWCYSSNSWNEGVLAPTFDEIIFPDAAFATVDNVPISLLSSKAIGSNLFKPFPAGKFQFLSFIVDKYSSAFRLSVIEDVKTCSLP